MKISSKSGVLCFGPSFFASAAFILSIFANSRCNLVSIDEGNPLDKLRVNNLGLWCYEDPYKNYWSIEGIQGDEKLQSARGIGTATLALGFVVWLFYLFAGCCRFGPNTFRCVGLFGVITCILQGCVFIILQSNVCAGGCGIGVGGNCAIAACVLWFFAGIFSCGAGKEAETSQETQGGGDDNNNNEEGAGDDTKGAGDDTNNNEEGA